MKDSRMIGKMIYIRYLKFFNRKNKNDSGFAVFLQYFPLFCSNLMHCREQNCNLLVLKELRSSLGVVLNNIVVYT